MLILDMAPIWQSIISKFCDPFFSFSEPKRDHRLECERQLGRQIAARPSLELRHFASEAGKIRWRRRSKLLTRMIRHNFKILEVGCGLGSLTSELEGTGAEVTAIDISPDLVEMAARTKPWTRIDFKVRDAHKTGFDANYFDAIVVGSALHHLELNASLREFHRILRPGGVLICSEPNLLNPLNFIIKKMKFLFPQDGESRFESALVRWSLHKELISVGFCNVQVRAYDFLYPSTPKHLIQFVQKLEAVFESMPIVKEFAGSLLVEASKPKFTAPK